MMLSSTAGCSTLARLCVFGSISAGPSGPHCHLEQRFISAAPPCLHPHTFTSVRHAAAVILMFITSDRKTRHWDDQSSSEGSEGSEGPGSVSMLVSLWMFFSLHVASLWADLTQIKKYKIHINMQLNAPKIQKHSLIYQMFTLLLYLFIFVLIQLFIYIILYLSIYLMTFFPFLFPQTFYLFLFYSVFQVVFIYSFIIFFMYLFAYLYIVLHMYVFI